MQSNAKRRQVNGESRFGGFFSPILFLLSSLLRSSLLLLLVALLSFRQRLKKRLTVFGIRMMLVLSILFLGSKMQKCRTSFCCINLTILDHFHCLFFSEQCRRLIHAINLSYIIMGMLRIELAVDGSWYENANHPFVALLAEFEQM